MTQFAHSVSIERADEDENITLLAHSVDEVDLWFEGPDGDCSLSFTRDQLDDLYRLAYKMMGW